MLCKTVKDLNLFISYILLIKNMLVLHRFVYNYAVQKISSQPNLGKVLDFSITSIVDLLIFFTSQFLGR